MNKTEQGVLQKNKLLRLLVHILLPLSFCLAMLAAAESIADTAIPSDNKHHVYVIYSQENTLYADISKKLTKDLNLHRPSITASIITPDKSIGSIDKNTDLIIGIGHDGIKNAREYSPEINKLFIASDHNDYKPHKNNAVYYMTQSYCRQLQFIKALNTHWKTVSILSSWKKNIDEKRIQQCADKYGIDIFNVITTEKDNLTNKVKQALRHSDVLLALPDSAIYNSRTVKNILLTSYRYRKPVIAFSKNFVNAGALASISSDTDQISLDAKSFIVKYFDSGMQFANKINHPDTFEIHINRQVFRALDLPTPDVGQIKKSLQEQEHPEESR